MTDPRPVSLVDLSGPPPGDVTLGGKAAELARLAALGLPVPPGVVVPAEAADADLDRFASEIADRFAGTTLAVRSSGVAEDLAEASFAGQYETLLGVAPTPEAIAEALRRVRASAGAAGVAAYAGRHDAAMAVLVMPMVDADAAGVAFTRDPVTGERVVVVEAVAGLGDRLAAGEATGERWRIDDRTVARLDDLGVLDEPTARSIADLAGRCEEVTGTPQDIEWAIADGRVLLLQARPITGVDDVEPVPIEDDVPPGPWSWDSTHNRSPATPLTASVFTEVFERASERLAATYGLPIRKLAMRSIGGYLYFQIVPLGGKPGAPPPPKPLMRLLFRLVPELRRAARTARTAWEQRIDRRLLEEWRTEAAPRIEETIDHWRGLDLAARSADELAELLEAAAATQREVFAWNMVTDLAYVLPLSDLHGFVEDRLGEGMATTIRLLAGASPSPYRTSATALAHRMSPELREAVLADPDPTRLSRLDPDFAAAYEEHLRRHGMRILGFDLSARTLLERPDLELARLATLPEPTDPTPEAERLAAELRATLDADDAARFDELLAEARRTYPIREEGEAVHAKAMGALRRFALEAGRRMVAAGHLEDPEHVVFLTLDEATSWLAAPRDLRELVRTRRGQHLWARGRSPAPHLGGATAPPDPDVFPPAIGRFMRAIGLIIAHDAVPADLEPGTDGVAASPGVHIGPARIVRGVDEFPKVRPGDVLVAPITTSPWEVLFPHIGALVTEGGGLLSHPAIVAREYALPAVVGCEGATSRFRDGQLLRVDGAAGTVTPIERQAPTTRGRQHQ